MLRGAAHPEGGMTETGKGLAVLFPSLVFPSEGSALKIVLG